MAEWAALPTDILVLIAKHVDFEDYFNLCAVCKSWYSVTSVMGMYHPLPSRFPWVMLTDKAEINFPKVTVDLDSFDMLVGEARKNEQIEGMHKRQFYSFSAYRAYEFELPEATRKKCIAVGYGLLLTLGFDLQINILNPFTRQQIGMPNMLSFKSNYEYDDELDPPQSVVSYFVSKVAMSSNPFNQSNEDCIVMAIYGEFSVLGFARPGDKDWTDLRLPLPVVGTYPIYQDVVYYNGKFHAVDMRGNIVVCDINDANEPKATPVACGGPDEPSYYTFRYLVESSGDLLLVVRFRNYMKPLSIDRPYKYTYGFSIFRMEECDSESSNNYRYKFTEVTNLGNRALFIGNNASVSVPCSKCVKANSIYFCDEAVNRSSRQPNGSGYDTGIYDVESGNITLHYAHKFMSHLTPPTWIISGDSSLTIEDRNIEEQVEQERKKMEYYKEFPKLERKLPVRLSTQIGNC